ncbi:proton channel OTOP2-like isoform X2 [Syngnathoides biaculeatus]|uniref:proton channel OTOP2-like isoform X2 n=1 Tax=Syngnathoides biaculeatus TaxID=300417 RepID=UPI002ADDE1A4|nr:proton channel OTOP2-like isoform X2 [Syngnathoides biaculeatus]
MCLNTGYPCNCLGDGNPCEPCRMSKDENSQGDDPLKEGGAQKTGEHDHPNHQPVATNKERDRNWGWILSGVIFINILMLGIALVSGSAYEHVDISMSDLQVFLVIILILTCIWMIYYIIFTARIENAVAYRDQHAGPVWLRGGMVLFGLLSIIMDVFKIGSYIGYLHCESAIKIVFPVIQLIFIVVQTYFMWVHAKDCVQLQRNLTRCGLMLTLSINLVLWMAAVTDESLHQTAHPDDDHGDDHGGDHANDTHEIDDHHASFGEDGCECSHTSCSLFKEAYFYLYPFNIEYSLFASAMAYVMWKNVGRLGEAHDPHGHSHAHKFHLKDAVVGPLVGVLLVFAGLATFIVYEMDMKEYEGEDHSKRDQAVMIHFIINIVIISLMLVATLIGVSIYKLDRREHDSEKNPTRNLDVCLLVGTSMGQFLISYFTIVAMVASGAQGHLNRLNLTWAILMVIQIGLQNFFIVEGLHREPFHEEHHEQITSVTNIYAVGHYNKEVYSLEGSEIRAKPEPEPLVVTPFGHVVHYPRKLSWKRRVLKEVSVFLLLANIILWIMPAFGARPQFDHPAETEFYDFTIWAAIVNVGLPFAIFYRMHSVAALLEVFVIS